MKYVSKYEKVLRVNPAVTRKLPLGTSVDIEIYMRIKKFAEENEVSFQDAVRELLKTALSVLNFKE